MSAPKVNHWQRVFGEAMATMRASYPSQRIPEGEWTAMVRVWAERLKDYPPQVLSQAMIALLKGSPDRMPTLPQALSACAAAQRSYTPEGKPLPRLPVTDRGREAHILGADSPLEQLARYWELEDRGKPNIATPHDVGQKRFKQFWQVFEKHEAWAKARGKGGAL